MIENNFFSLNVRNKASGHMRLPGSKSISNRVILLSALCNEKVEIINYLQSEDTDVMLSVLDVLGVKFQKKTHSEYYQSSKKQVPVSVNGGDEIIEMTRMGKLIAHHMIDSVTTSAHVQSFVECDVTNIWNWRNRVKNAFEKREGEKLTFTPIFMEAVAKALRDFPMMNIQVDGDRIIKKKDINLGMAAALPDGNLIVANFPSLAIN